ncbi:hypothetical protein BDV24DRAFT_171090 [Aspergillus arachidicola]|uniref:TauD/TfdA-like domain-containing protein n=1 Tax=Aspergillus arachidicola TaxID=656916 RepID=A0A5N6YI47_9EURO|nr:hypothetical protein BDV24DRAFT_171090 [Aspergillus arachidicola]
MSTSTTETVTAPAPTPSLRVIKNGFGAEITGLDFANGVTDEGYKFIEDAVKKHGFAVVRKTKLVDETHLELARKFGELDDVTPYNKAGRIHRLKYNELFDVGNIDVDGSIVDLSSPRGEANKGNALFHTDSSFNPRRAGYSLLLAHELPPPATGGSTAFADMRAAYRDLDPEFKKKLHEKNFIARHSLLHSKKMAAPECFKDIEPEDHFMSRHWLLQVHERTGIPTIYLAKHIHSLEGVSPEESQSILDRLFDHATQDKYVIEVEWKDVGDMIVWDNTCTMHRAISGEFLTNDGIGEPKKPPCVGCYESGNECILLTKSRRGGNFKHYRAGPRLDTISGPQHEMPSDDEESVVRDNSGGVLTMDLRNPSDALHILALSGDQPRARHSTTSPNSASAYLVPGSTATTSNQPVDPQYHVNPTHAIFDDYELVQRGLLRPSLVSELLLKYVRYYHPYCPIVPAYLLRGSNLGKIQKSDSFLLTVILTIASRDDPCHALTHRYCWDHSQRLLVDVLLAHPWTQTPRTVEGLLLLAEWLPHTQIQETTSETPKNLFSEDRMAWSLVGLAVRHGYLQRLDQAAFPNYNSSDSKEQADQNRLVWAYIFIADRQISVRLGQSFWSRGPSLAAKFAAHDFPTLQPCPENDNEDYASVLQASMELIQILHNAHAILYSSKERTLAMVYEGHYARYLDDFRNAATTWHSTWSTLAVSPSIKSTLLIMYEYISLYTNAFSFQAVLTRYSDPRTSTAPWQASKGAFAGLLSNGIMASPDGRYIFDAISAAMNLLDLMNSLDPHRTLSYLPSRYHLYGVYAAVLLHKADCAGAFQSSDQRHEVQSLARKFVSSLDQAPSTESHICHSYSRMLKQLWRARESKSKPSRTPKPTPVSSTMNLYHRHKTSTKPQQPLPTTNEHTTPSDSFSPSRFFESLPGEDDNGTAAFPSIEGYFLGSFMPGVADFSTPSFWDGLPPHSVGEGFQDWGLYQGGVDSQDPI